MKNYKLIPLLAMSAFLAGCTVGNSSSIKEPKFAKMGKEVTYEEFLEVATEYDLIGVWADPNRQHVPSFEATVKANYDSTSKTTSKKKVVAGYNAKFKGSASVKADMNNFRIAAQFDSVMDTVKFDEYENVEEREEEKEDKTFQFNEIDMGVDEVEMHNVWIQYDNLTKVATTWDDMTGAPLLDKRDFVETNALMWIDSYDIIPSVIPETISQYPNKSLRERECYKFFLNEKVLTITYHNEYYSSEQDASDHAANYIETVAEDTTYQLDATKGENFSLKIFTETTTTKEYLRTMIVGNATRFIGDVEKGVLKYSFESDMKVKDVKIKEAKLDDYKLVNNLFI